MLRTSLVTLATLLAGLHADTCRATSNGIDDFQDGTTQGWVSGPPNPNPPVHVADDGPAGSGDGFLRVTATGSFGAGGRMIAYNESQWTGDFLNADLSALSMDVRNFGREPMELRVALENTDIFGIAASTTGVPLAANSDWQTIVLPIAIGDLTEVGAASLVETLSNVSRMRIVHNTEPSRVGLPYVGQLGIDNIRAIAIPEPSTLLIGLTAAMLLTRRTNRR